MRRVRPKLLLGPLVAAIALAGCGSNTSGSAALMNEFSYFPADSPLVMTIATDPNSPSVRSAQGLLHSIPTVTFGETALFTKLAQLGVSYDGEIRPLFGNPVAVGLVGSGGGETTVAPGPLQAVVVWTTRDPSALGSLMKKLSEGLQSQGTRDGATLYQVSGITLAVQGATIVAANSPEVMIAALDRHAHGGGITSTEYNRLASGLSRDALIQVFGTLSQALSAKPLTAKARGVPWVAALRGYAGSMTASSAGLGFQYRLDTSGGRLTSAEVPVTSGSALPPLAGTLPISVGIAAPAHAYAFAQSLEQTESPTTYATFVRQQARLRQRTGADLSSLVGLMTNLDVESDTHTTMIRAQLSNPSAATQTLAELSRDPQDLYPNTLGLSTAPGGFYLVKLPQRTIAVGVVRSQLVAGNATPGQLRSLASAPSTPIPGFREAVAFRVALSDLFGTALKGGSGTLGKAVLGTLGDLTGWSSATTASMTGQAILRFR